MVTRRSRSARAAPPAARRPAPPPRARALRTTSAPLIGCRRAGPAQPQSMSRRPRRRLMRDRAGVEREQRRGRQRRRPAPAAAASRPARRPISAAISAAPTGTVHSARQQLVASSARAEAVDVAQLVRRRRRRTAATARARSISCSAGSIASALMAVLPAPRRQQHVARPSGRLHAAQEVAAHRVVDAERAAELRRGEQQRRVVLRHLDVADRRAARTCRAASRQAVERPRSSCARTRSESRRSSDPGLRSSMRCDAPVRREVVDPDLLARLLVRVGAAAVHERVQPPAALVHGQMLHAADAPRLLAVGVAEQRPRLAEADLRRRRRRPDARLPSNDTNSHWSP